MGAKKVRPGRDGRPGKRFSTWAIALGGKVNERGRSAFGDKPRAKAGHYFQGKGGFAASETNYNFTKTGGQGVELSAAGDCAAFWQVSGSVFAEKRPIMVR